MARYRNILILGTSHIAKESIERVKEAIEKTQPEVIALELDEGRLRSLTTKKKASKKEIIKVLGIKGFLFNSIGAGIEQYLGKKTGIIPGTEMKTAIEIAKEKNIKIAVIDQPIQITIRKLVSSITRKEIKTFIKEFLSSLISTKKQEKFDLNKIPSQKLIKELIKETKEKYPSIYKVLVQERNVYMAKKLNKLRETYPKQQILAIVGAGHEKDIIGELKSIEKQKQV